MNTANLPARSQSTTPCQAGGFLYYSTASWATSYRSRGLRTDVQWEEPRSDENGQQR